MRRATATLIFVLLVGPVPAAGAQQPGRCYPPPCAAEEPALSDPTTVSPISELSSVGGTAAESDVRSPVPFVGTGLLAIIGSLTVVALRRRRNIVRRSDGPVRTPLSPPVGGPVAPEPHPVLR